MTPRVLVIDDEANFVASTVYGLTAHGIAARGATTAAGGLADLAVNRTDIVILDQRLPDGNGVDFIPEIRTANPDAKIVMISAHGDIPTAVEAVRRGALDFMTKPFDLDDLVTVIRQITAPADGGSASPNMSSCSPVGSMRPPLSLEMEDLKSTVGIVARSSARVILLLGPSGSGKSFTARTVHAESYRANSPFIVVNCASLPGELLESELFGVVRGAYTGAHTARTGLVEAAEGGTLFLDEIAEMSAGLQAKLLGFLESRRYRRLGSSQEHVADIRIVAASNRDLDAEVAAGRFRLDLFYRLNVVPITLPRLSDHSSDIMPLARHFAALAGAAERCAPVQFCAAAEAVFTSYLWPGNIRELSNLVERLTILHPGAEIGPHHLPPEMSGGQPDSSSAIESQLSRTERDILIQAIRAAGGHKAKAAEALGISRHALKRRMKRLVLM